MGYFTRLVKYLHQPEDPSILAYARIAFGILMLVDIPQERGMTKADYKYGIESAQYCRFPLFNFLEPLPFDYMVLLYAVMFTSAIGIVLGLFYRVCSLFFCAIYWFIFFLDKSTWNNHSYLYGLLGFIFLITDAHRYASIDGWFRKGIKNSHVPSWNYSIIKFQIFLVYFYAGLKKTERDWLLGYSMQNLTRHWVFDPMRFFMDDKMLDLVVVHIGGFTLDISAGFLLFFDRTRYFAFVMIGMFHAMNSQIFNIGMFPYAMIATMFIFCQPDSFKKIASECCPFLFDSKPAQPNTNCFYINNSTNKNNNTKISWKQWVSCVVTFLYISEQLFLPYSHFITKGYNGWTEGPYGYSWDMMVHTFKNQHSKITYIDKHGNEGYLKPGAFLQTSKSRWSAHPDMTVQYASCLKQKLQGMGIEEPRIYFDVWKSLNGRFQQRVFDPRIDIASYPWSPFQTPTFVFPVLSQLSDWRTKLSSLKEEIKHQNMTVTFMADFPGLVLENYLHSDYGITYVEVLKGKISVEIESQPNTILTVGQKMKLPCGQFHKVHTISDEPSCYFYVYVNTTQQQLEDKVVKYRRQKHDKTTPREFFKEDIINIHEDDRVVELFKKQELDRENSMQLRNRTLAEKFGKFLHRKTATFRRSFLLAIYSVRNIVIGTPKAIQLKSEKVNLDAWHSRQSILASNPNEQENEDQKRSEL